jgi:DNA repair exonuclease SbcCD ATPase subunit
MINYDNDLIRLQQKVAMKKQLEAKLNDLRSQRCVFDKKIIELRVEHRSEQEDVKKLECRSLANYFYQLFGKLDEKLDEERKEASAAKVKLDAAERELAVVDHEIQEIQTLLRELYGCEEAYSATLEAKRDAVKSSNTPAACQILELEEKIAFLESQKKEIREAITAGHSAIGTADNVLSELEDADDWNTWDMLGGGGIITHMAKHSHLDEAQEKVEQLQGKLRRFKTELADINIHADMQVSIDGFLRFADYFFDGLFADWAVGDKISESQSSVQKVKSQISSALSKLDGMDKDADAQIRSLKAKIEELLVNG